MGHILPGFFFIVLGLWGAYSLLIRYYRSRYNRHVDKFRANLSYPCQSGCLSKLPLEGIIKVLVTIIATIGELATAFEDGKWTYFNNAQHISMYAFFCLNGIVDILFFYKVNIPSGMDYATGFLAYIVEAIIFSNHLHGRTHMDTMLHTLLIYLVYGCIISVALEARYRDSILIALNRCFFSILQGSWLFQISFILYPFGAATWDQEDHDQLMMVTVIYSWHFAGAFLTLLALLFIVSKIARRHAPIDVSDVRNGIQYQKVDLNNLSDGDDAKQRKLKQPNGTTALKSAFVLDSSEDEL